MILIDSRVGSKELHDPIRRIGVSCQLTTLEFGDTCFEGSGPHGPIMVGFERKTLHDCLNCIDDSRLSGHQLPGMRQTYGNSFLVIEGHWRAHSDGRLLEGFNNGQFWKPCAYRGREIMYSKLRRFLYSVEMSGIHVMITHDLFQTAYDICELYYWYQKAWDSHTSMLGKQNLLLPSLESHLPLVHRWAAEVGGIGVKLSQGAAKNFKTGLKLANADEQAWIKAGVPIKTAIRVVREIREGKA